MSAPLAPAELAEILLPQLPPAPYPGLRPFKTDEWPIFFGRERMTDEAIALLLDHRLVVVHGASGGGKSSLVQAGVQARLQQQHARSGLRWRTCAMRPGSKCLESLTESLSEVVGDVPRIEIRRVLNGGQDAPAALAKLLHLGEADRLCILLDQFEELFRFSREVSRDEASLLADFLVGFERAPPGGVYILVTMRSEFLGECARFDGLPETINRTQYLLPRMNTDDLLRAVREPAALYDGAVTDRLAERLVADSRGGQDELPLIQHGLSRLWHFASPATSDPDGPAPILDLPAYEKHGPLGRLLSEHADQIADGVAGDADGQRIVEELFRALTDINADGNAVRRPQPFAVLAAVAGTTEARLQAILDAFRAAGVSFVTPFAPQPIDAGTTIDISHEALIRRWQRIDEKSQGWLQKEFRDGLIWRALLVQAESFRADPESLLSEATTEARSAWLTGRNEAWAGRYGGQWASVQDLMAASQREVEREHARLEAEQKRETELRLAQERGAAAERLSQEQGRRAEAEAANAMAERRLAQRRRWQFWVVAAVALLLLGVAWSAAVQRRNAETARDLAAQEEERANRATQAAMDAQHKAESALQERLAAETSAARTQISSGQVLATAYAAKGSDADASASILAQLRDARDPYQVAVLAQGIASLPGTLTADQSAQISAIMSQAIRDTTNPSTAAAIAQALAALVPKLASQDVQKIADAVVQDVGSVSGEPRLAALAAVVQSVVPTMTPEQAQAALTLLQKTSEATDAAAGILAPALRALTNRAAGATPRLYIHIAQESQREPARQLELLLEQATINGDHLVIPGIELVPNFNAASQVRCFRVQECQSDGGPIVETINQLLNTPKVRLEDASATYGDATNIRDRHYELWLGPGQITLRDHAG